MRFGVIQLRSACMRVSTPLLAMLFLAASAWAGSPPDMSTPRQDARAGMQADRVGNEADNIHAVPLPWSQLDPAQRMLLEPLRSQWDQLPPRRQQRMAAHARRWTQLPPDRRAQIQQRLTHWAQITPEQRRAAWRGEDRFHTMPEADRQRVIDAYQRFKSLSPEQRKALMQRFRDERKERHGANDSSPAKEPGSQHEPGQMQERIR